jgi:hypothetical protein
VNKPDSTPTIPPEVLKKDLQPLLFPDESGLSTYAVLDGASIPELLDHLYADPRPEFVCLYRGELEPDMAEVAPYLVRLEANAPFTDWLLAEGWGRHWGILVVSPANLTGMRKHFRTFLMVRDPEGKQLYFRYYDPRVLRLYLPTCDAEESKLVFGPVVAYFCESQDPDTLLRFVVAADEIVTESLPIAQGGVQ